MNAAQEIALFYAVPIALWVSLLAIVVRVWWSHRLEESLAYLVYLRERKRLFVTLIAGLALTQLVNATNRLFSVFAPATDPYALSVSVAAAVAGGLLVVLFGWLLLGRVPRSLPKETVLDVPEHLAYTLGVLDRAQERRGPP